MNKTLLQVDSFGEIFNAKLEIYSKFQNSRLVSNIDIFYGEKKKQTKNFQKKKGIVFIYLHFIYFFTENSKLNYSGHIFSPAMWKYGKFLI